MTIQRGKGTMPIGIAALTTTVLMAQPLPSVPSIIASTQFESRANTYTVQLIPGRRVEVKEVLGLYCGNGDMSPELQGDFALVLKLGSQELSRAVLREGTFVSDKNEWRARNGEAALELFERPTKEPLIGIRQYRGCNGNDYFFFWIDSQHGRPVLKPVKFVGDRRQATSSQGKAATNQLYASFEPGAVRLLDHFDGAKDILELDGYDNAGGFWYVDQFIEDAQGVWRFSREIRK